ncbi:MAG TPA: thiamine pyrophosphate-dependent enzyme [Ramlibacter sp.]|nr:thiamine pyrophosphate-dependent enzyme [Ramlibacter sp.]
MPKIIELRPDAPWIELQSEPQDWDAIGAAELLRMHYHLHVIRAFEETVLEFEKVGLVNGPLHSSIGQEAGAVGAMALLNSRDMITGAHRGHHQFIAKGMRHLDDARHDPRSQPLPEAVTTFLYRALAEILGLADGFCKGRGGSMHLRWTECGAMGTNAIVGGGVPIANGLAWAKKREGKGQVAMTFFGDGSAHIGSVPESMNLAALWALPLAFFIENNGYAVATRVEEQAKETRLSARGGGFAIPAWRVDGMDLAAVATASRIAVQHMRAGKGPALIEALVYRFLHHGGSLLGSAFGYRDKDEEAQWKARDPIARTAREMISRGWLTAQQDEAIRANVVAAMGLIASRLREDDPATGKPRIRPALWPKTEFRDHGLRGDLSEFEGARFEELESASAKTGEVKFVDAIATVMGRRMETDERIFVMGEDIHRLKGGTNGATKGLAQRFPDRIVPTPIEEGGFAGLCGGVAMEGSYRPVVEFMYADFTLVAADQVFNQIGKSRHMFGGDSPMPLVLRTKCAIGTGYGSQHSMEPAGLYSQWPGWRIVAPSTPFDYVGLMNSALLCEDPVLVIEHVDLYNTNGPAPVEDWDYYIPLGKAKVVRPGKAFTVLTYLAMVPLALKVARELDVDAEIIDLRSLDRAGIDWQTIGASITKTNNVVVLEQGTLTVSYGAMLTDEIQRRYFDHLDQPVQRIHGGESSPSVSKVLERSSHAGAEEIRAGFARMMADSGRPLK